MSPLDDLIALLKNFNGRTFSGKISAETYFFKDLGMASIDAVVLAEMLEAYYGRTFPFNSFLATLQQRDVRDLQLGELAEFLLLHLQKASD